MSNSHSHDRRTDRDKVTDPRSNHRSSHNHRDDSYASSRDEHRRRDSRSDENNGCRRHSPPRKHEHGRDRDRERHRDECRYASSSSRRDYDYDNQHYHYGRTQSPPPRSHRDVLPHEGECGTKRRSPPTPPAPISPPNKQRPLSPRPPSPGSPSSATASAVIRSASIPISSSSKHAAPLPAHTIDPTLLPALPELPVNPEFPPDYPPLLPPLDEQSLQEVFTHRTFGSRESTGFKDPEGKPSFNNERLEILGDAVLGTAVIDMIICTWPALREGAITNLRDRLVCTATLSHISTMYELPSRLFVGASGAISLRQSAKVRADTLEAYIGAVYRAAMPLGSIAAVREWLDPLLLPYASAYLAKMEEEAASKSSATGGGWVEVVNALYRDQGKTVTYEFGDETHEGLANLVIWRGRMLVDGRVVAEGEGGSKKKAKAMMAEIVARNVGLLDNA